MTGQTEWTAPAAGAVRDTRPWVRSRFRAAPDDWRTSTWPPPGPCWCTGWGDGYSTVVAYHREGQDVREWWPEATHIDAEAAPEGPLFTGRFPRPQWWHGDGRDVK